MITIDLSTLTPLVVVTCVYILFYYYLLLGRQGRTKRRLEREYRERGEVFDRYHGNDPEMLAVDRVAANTHEQLVPFLVSFWMYGVIVSPFYAAILGGVYIVLRAVYPILLGKQVSKINTKKVAFVTFPCYFIILTFLIGSLLTALGIL